MALSTGILESAYTAALECETVKHLLGPSQASSAGPIDLPPPPFELVRQLSGCVVDQVQLILGEDGILRFFKHADLLREILLAWIAALPEMADEQVNTDLAVFAAFLTEHRFHWYETIDPSNPLTAPTAARHILWTLSKDVPGAHTKLYAALRRFSPKRFGYEKGPWEHNPDLPDLGIFLATLPSSLPVFTGGAAGPAALPADLFGGGGGGAALPPTAAQIGETLASLGLPDVPETYPEGLPPS